MRYKQEEGLEETMLANIGVGSLCGPQKQL